MPRRLKVPWLVIGCSLFVFIFTNLFSFFVFHHIPHINDEISYLFQANIFKSGKLYAPSSCEKEFFNFTHIINNGKWYSQYTPGYPFLLMLALFINAPWLLNPLLAALSIILFYFLGKEIYNEQVGRLAAVLGTISIWFLLMSSTMLSHTSCMFFTAMFLLFLFRSTMNPSIMNGLLAGMGLGMAFLIRPYTAVLISLPFLFFYFLRLPKYFKTMLKNSVALSLILIISVCALLVYNNVTNGNFFTMGYEVCYGKEHGLGFGKTGYTDTPHNPLLGSLQVWNYAKAINKDLFGWPFSSFLAILPLFFIPLITSEYIKKDLLLASGFFSLLAGLFFYWGTYILVGARMSFEAIPILLLLSARGITELPRIISLKFKRINQANLKKAGVLILIFFTLYAFLYRFPRWIWPADTEWYYDGFGNNFARVTHKIHNTLQSLGLTKALVIMKSIYYPIEFFPYGWLGSGFLHNDPNLERNIIYARDLGDENIKLIRCFPDRNIYLYFGTLEKGMLFPLLEKGNEILFGEPIRSNKRDEEHIELIDEPQKFYTIYSRDFGNFINAAYDRENSYDIDVFYLVDRGNQFLIEKDYKKAAYYFEAALQVDKNPEERLKILNKLVSCYLKTGNGSEAKKVLTIINNTKKVKLFQVIPYKGF